MATPQAVPQPGEVQPAREPWQTDDMTAALVANIRRALESGIAAL
jgi:hypothetical protein